MVIKEEIIELECHPEDDKGQKIMNQTMTLRLREVSYQDEKTGTMSFYVTILRLGLRRLPFCIKNAGVSSFYLKR